MEHYVELPPRPKKCKIQDPCPKLDVPVASKSQMPEQPQMPKPLEQPELDFVEDPLRDQEFGTIQQWFKGKSDKPLLIIGPTGSGKTTLIKYYSKMYNKAYELYESDLESEYLTKNCLGPLIAVFDNIEDLSAKERQLIKASFSWASKRHLVFTSLDAFEEPTKTWQKNCITVKLGLPSKFFIEKILQVKTSNNQLIKDLIESCNLNISVALRSLELLQKTSSLTGCKNMYALVPLDVPKATRQILDGKRLMCMGDSSFLLQQLQINTPQIAKNLHQLAKTMDAYSALEILDSRHIMDTESLWHSIDQVATCGPKINGSKFEFTWPKSLKPIEKPTMKYL